MNEEIWGWIVAGLVVLLIAILWGLFFFIERKPYGRSPLSDAERREVEERAYQNSWIEL